MAMFDAKSLLDKLVGAAGQGQPGQQPGAGGLLGSVLGQLASPQQQPGQPAQPGGMGGMLGGVLGQLSAGAQPQQPGQPAQPGMGGMLGSVLGGLGSALGGAGGAAGQPAPGGAAGALIAKAKEFLATEQGKMIATGAAGTLAGLVLGGGTGRAIAGSAVKVGALAAIGGLAYVAYNNYRSGKPLMDGVPMLDQLTGTTPAGAPEDANEHATLVLRAMIAAAAADGVIDEAERAAIIGAASVGGLTPEEQAFIEREIAAPMSIADLAAAATTEELRSELYLAASLAIIADTETERAWMAALAQHFGFDANLVAHLDAAAASAKAQGA
jgi:uncharacterized membrane protein YebE (DUF533 family)